VRSEKEAGSLENFKKTKPGSAVSVRELAVCLVCTLRSPYWRLSRFSAIQLQVLPRLRDNVSTTIESSHRPPCLQRWRCHHFRTGSARNVPFEHSQPLPDSSQSALSIRDTSKFPNLHSKTSDTNHESKVSCQYLATSSLVNQETSPRMTPLRMPHDGHAKHEHRQRGAGRNGRPR
jgi:hypothetical protein